MKRRTPPKKPKKRTASNQTRRKNHKKAGKFPIDKWVLRVEYFDWCCRYCGVKLTEETLTVDHQIPISRGGTNLPANLVPACDDCNCAKANKTPKEFRKDRIGKNET